VKLGNPTNANECLKQARAARSVVARRRAENVRPIVDQIMRSGATTLRAIAGALTARGIKTARGGTRWHAEQVATVLRLTSVCEGSPFEPPSRHVAGKPMQDGR